MARRSRKKRKLPPKTTVSDPRLQGLPNLDDFIKWLDKTDHAKSLFKEFCEKNKLNYVYDPEAWKKRKNYSCSAPVNYAAGYGFRGARAAASMTDPDIMDEDAWAHMHSYIVPRD